MAERPKQDAPMDVYPSRVTAWHHRIARRIGAGNYSEGVRICIEEHWKRLKELDHACDHPVGGALDLEK